MLIVRSRLVVPVGLVVATAVACGGSSGGGSIAPPTTAASSTASASASATPSAPADNLPSEALMKSALLTASEVGPNFTEDTSNDSSDSSKASGCPTLAALLNKNDSPSPGTREVDVSLAAGADSNNPIFFDEGLIAEDGAKFATDFATFRNALATCKSLTLPIDATTTLTLTLTPINFAPSATAARLDGSIQGTPVNGYLAISSPHDGVALLFFIFQAGSGSSQFASSLYEQAESKASATLK